MSCFETDTTNYPYGYDYYAIDIACNFKIAYDYVRVPLNGLLTKNLFKKS